MIILNNPWLDLIIRFALVFVLYIFITKVVFKQLDLYRSKLIHENILVKFLSWLEPLSREVLLNSSHNPNNTVKSALVLLDEILYRRDDLPDKKNILAQLLLDSVAANLNKKRDEIIEQIAVSANKNVKTLNNQLSQLETFGTIIAGYACFNSFRFTFSPLKPTLIIVGESRQK